MKSKPPEKSPFPPKYGGDVPPEEGQSKANQDFVLAWRRNWIHCIYEFASTKLQRMAWLEGPSADWPDGQLWCSDFGECYCRYFDGLALSDGGYAARVDEGLLSQAEADLAADFHQAADKYAEASEKPEEIIKDPNWMAVTEQAATLWHALKNGFTRESDRIEVIKLERLYGAIPIASLTLRANSTNVHARARTSNHSIT